MCCPLDDKITVIVKGISRAVSIVAYQNIHE